MSRIFLSHSSIDELEAVALKQWLLDEGWDDVFLDIDPERGLVAGERWQEALRRAADHCEAVVFIVTPTWARSKWCLAEFLLAKSLHKLIFGAILKEVAINELPTEMASEWQLCHLVGIGPKRQVAFSHRGEMRQIEFLADGLARLRNGLNKAGLDARHFPWPPADDPKRSPYPGLAALEEKDAAVYFGRDAQIQRGLDALRGMRAAGIESLFVILGPSGTGKSSFLRAGLLPRLKRDDRHFLSLGIIRPQRHPLSGKHGLATVLHEARQTLGLEGTLGDIKAKLAQDQLASLLVDIQRAALARLTTTEGIPPPTLFLAIDQAEELFTLAEIRFKPDETAGLPAEVQFHPAEELSPPHASGEAGRFLDMVGRVVRVLGPASLIVAFTIRSDRYEPLQTAPELAGLKGQVFDDLKPMPPQQFKEIITGPADRATAAGNRLNIKPDLVDRLLGECTQGADTLPLLSLTLERLYRDYGSDGELSLEEYEAMGGIRSVVNHVVESCLPEDTSERQIQLAVLREAFIPWLATINPQSDEPMRRRARRSDLPEASTQIIDALVDNRLLTLDESRGQVFVEVAHESLLRQWDQLAAWLREQGENLKAADALERAAQEWEKSGRHASWLIDGERLSLAESLAAKPGFQRRLEPTREFLLASRQDQDRKQAEEEQRQQRELIKAKELAAEQTARADTETKARSQAQTSALALRKRAYAMVVIAIMLLLVTIVAFLAWQRKEQQTLTANLNIARTFEAQAICSLDKGERDHNQSDYQDAWLYALEALHQQVPSGEIPLRGKIIGAFAATPIRQPFAGKWFSPALDANVLVKSLAFSPNGRILASGSWNNNIELWDASSGKLLSTLEGHSDVVSTLAFSPDGSILASGSGDNTLRLWDAASGKPLQTLLSPSLSISVQAVAFSPDGKRLVGGYYNDVLHLWDIASGQLLLTLKGHAGPVNAVAFSPDGKTIVSGSSDNTLRLWDASRGMPLHTLEGHAGPIQTLAFSPAGHILASGSEDRSLRLWDTGSGNPVRSLEGHGGAVSALAFSPDGKVLASGSSDKTLRIWDMPSGRPLRTLTGHAEAVYALAFSPDGKTLASGSEDRTLRLWDTASGRPLQPVAGHAGSISAVAISPDGNTIATGSRDNRLLLWDATSGKVLRVLDGHAEPVNALAFSPDGKILVSGSDDKTLHLWDTANGKTIRILEGHGGPVHAVAFCPDGQTLASGAGDKSLRTWDAASGTPLRTLDGHTEPVTAVAFGPAGQTLASGSEDKTLRLWDAASGRSLLTLLGHSEKVRAVAFSHDGKTLASGSEDATLRLWDIASGKATHTLKGHAGTVHALAFSPGDKTLVSGSSDRTLLLWDTASGETLGRLQDHKGRVFAVAFGPDGNTLISGAGDNTLRLWDVSGDKIQRTLIGHSGWVAAAAFSPDGKILASGSWDNTLRLWDTASGAVVGTLEGHIAPVSALAFSPDGKTLASGSWDTTLRLWDIASGKAIRTLEGHTHSVFGVAFSPDGRMLASGSGDKTLRLWDVVSGETLRILNGHTDMVSAVAFSPDGKTLASGSWDKTLRLWDLSGGGNQCSNAMVGHVGPIEALAFGPDGKTLASGSRDTTLRLWDAAGCRPLQTLEGHKGWTTAVGFSPDGKILVSGSWDKTLRLWDLASGETSRTLEGHTSMVSAVAFSPDGKTLVSGSYDKTLRLWDVSGMQVLNKLAAAPALAFKTSETLRFLWERSLSDIEFIRQPRRPSLFPIESYYLADADNYSALLKPPAPGETKLDQVLRWAEEELERSGDKGGKDNAFIPRLWRGER